jgi:hypothetical protein
VSPGVLGLQASRRLEKPRRGPVLGYTVDELALGLRARGLNTEQGRYRTWIDRVWQVDAQGSGSPAAGRIRVIEGELREHGNPVYVRHGLSR